MAKKTAGVFDHLVDHEFDHAPTKPHRAPRRENGFDKIRRELRDAENKATAAAWKNHDAAADYRRDPWECDAPSAEDDMRGRFTSAEAALKFMRAGNATVTLKSLRTGVRFTFRLRESDDGTCIFVGLLTGPGNETDYSYLGRISRDIFWAGRKVPKPGDVSKDAPSMKAFDWSWRALIRGNMPEALEVWHEGSCGRCGRKLTVPSSIAAGFGPECAGKMGM